jgi:hypothetical protein
MPNKQSSSGASAQIGQPRSDPNPPYGKKGTFRKIATTVPQEIYERLMNESARRKIAGEPAKLLSAMLREALSLYLDGSDSV